LTHRFLVMKPLNLNDKNVNSALKQNTCPLNLYDYIDIKKEMGDFISNEMEQIINN
jgi:hypothetical protein